MLSVGRRTLARVLDPSCPGDPKHPARPLVTSSSTSPDPGYKSYHVPQRRVILAQLSESRLLTAHDTDLDLTTKSPRKNLLSSEPLERATHAPHFNANCDQIWNLCSSYRILKYVLSLSRAYEWRRNIHVVPNLPARRPMIASNHGSGRPCVVLKKSTSNFSIDTVVHDTYRYV